MKLRVIDKQNKRPHHSRLVRFRTIYVYIEIGLYEKK